MTDTTIRPKQKSLLGTALDRFFPDRQPFTWAEIGHFMLIWIGAVMIAFVILFAIGVGMGGWPAYAAERQPFYWQGVVCKSEVPIARFLAFREMGMGFDAATDGVNREFGDGACEIDVVRLTEERELGRVVRDRWFYKISAVTVTEVLTENGWEALAKPQERFTVFLYLIAMV